MTAIERVDPDGAPREGAETLDAAAELDARFVLMPMPAEFVKGIAEPVVTYAVREGPSATAPSAEQAGNR